MHDTKVCVSLRENSKLPAGKLELESVKWHLTDVFFVDFRSSMF